MNDSRWGYLNVFKIMISKHVEVTWVHETKGHWGWGWGGGRITSSLLLHMILTWLIVSPMECPALVLDMSSSATSVSVTSKSCLHVPHLFCCICLRTDTLVSFTKTLFYRSVQCPLMRDLLLPSALFCLVMWLHSIPYLCWSIFLLLLPLIINGCLSKSFIFFFSDLLCSFTSHSGLPDAWLLVCLLLIARFRGNRWRRGSGEETRPWP